MVTSIISVPDLVDRLKKLELTKLYLSPFDAGSEMVVNFVHNASNIWTR